MNTNYDVIIVGARVAGAATAMMLAKKGYKVLVVDKATFPSDTMSTHQIQLPGVAKLKQWGRSEQVQATNCPPTTHVTFDPGFAVVKGVYPTFGGVNAVHSPRRYLLDKLLLDAAVAAGAEVREDFVVETLLMEGDHVTGLRGHSHGGTTVTDRARLVIGADGKHSLVAKQVNAPTYYEKPARSFGYYTYYEGVTTEQGGGEMVGRQNRLMGVWPTNDQQVVIYVAGPISEFQKFRSDIEGNFAQALALAPHLAERVNAGRRMERFVGTADLPNFFRKPYGPGWALVGDAGYHRDPITGQGIADAWRDAELLTDAIDAGLAGRLQLNNALAAYEAQRNAAALPMYEFTTQLVAFAPPAPEERQLFAALQDNPAAASQFFGVMTGAVPIPTFFAPGNLLRIMGPRRMFTVMWQKLWTNHQQPAPSAAVAPATR